MSRIALKKETAVFICAVNEGNRIERSSALIRYHTVLDKAYEAEMMNRLQYRGLLQTSARVSM